MANFPIDETQKAVNQELRKIETSDPVHADVYNALLEQLINNDAFLERLAKEMIRQSMISHVLDSVNPNMVLGADVGPKITEITEALQQSITVLNTNFEWKLAFSVQGAGNRNLASQFKELLVIANAGAAYNTFIHVPHTFLTNEWQNFSTSHYVTQSDNSFVGFKATKSFISLVVSYTNNGTDSSSLCKYSVYYR